MANAFDQFDTAKGNAFDQFDAPAKSAQPQPKAGWRDILYGANDQNYKAGTVEAAANIGSSVLASPVAGIAGLLQGAKNWVSPGMSAADRVEQVQKALTYEPRTTAGKEVTQAATYPLQKFGEGVQAVSDQVFLSDPQRRQYLYEPGAPPIKNPNYRPDAAGNNAVAATLANVAGNMAPALLFRGKPNAGAAVADTAEAVGSRAATQAAELSKVPVAQEITPTQVARQAGYKLKPSEAEGSGQIAKTAEGLSGSAKLETSLSVKNQKITNDLIRKEIGLDPKQQINRANLEKLKSPHNKVYDRVGNELGRFPTDQVFLDEIVKVGGEKGLSKAARAAIEDMKSEYAADAMTAADALAEMRALRAQANKTLKSPAYNPELEARAYAQLQISDAIESQLERRAQATGKPELLKEFRDARTSLAKINTAERSLVGGDFSAGKIAKMAEKKQFLSGGFKTVADVAREFPNVTRDASKLKNRVPVTVLEGVATAGGYAAVGPKGLVILGARPAARGILSSDLYQNSLGKPRPPLKAAQNNLLLEDRPRNMLAPTGALAIQDKRK